MNIGGGYLPPSPLNPAAGTAAPPQQINPGLLAIVHALFAQGQGVHHVGSRLLDDNGPVPVNAGQVAAGTEPAYYAGQPNPAAILNQIRAHLANQQPPTFHRPPNLAGSLALMLQHLGY